MREIKLEPTVLRSGEVACFDHEGKRMTDEACQAMGMRTKPMPRSFYRSPGWDEAHAEVVRQSRARVMQQLDDALAPMRVKQLEEENARLRARLAELGEDTP